MDVLVDKMMSGRSKDTSWSLKVYILKILWRTLWTRLGPDKIKLDMLPHYIRHFGLMKFLHYNKKKFMTGIPPRDMLGLNLNFLPEQPIKSKRIPQGRN